MNVLSLFDGISCGQVALERAGIAVDKYYASEIDRHAIKVTQANYPDTVQLGDITRWREWDIDWSSIDLLTFGSPCQSYSVAGLQKGLNDKRGQLIFDVFDIIEHCKPPVFMMENVMGLVSIEKGAVFAMILQKFNELGYAVDYKFINSALVSAQNRKRVYIMGKRLDACQGLEYSVDFNEDLINVKSRAKADSRNATALL